MATNLSPDSNQPSHPTHARCQGCGHPAIGHDENGCWRDVGNEICNCEITPEQITDALAAENARLRAALEKIDRITTEWDANKLGGVELQRKRWQRCGAIAQEALGGAK